MADKGIPFLLNDVVEIGIRLTPEGISKYNSILHLRPPYTRKTKDGLYIFHSTEMQIEFYFLKFGKDAEVLYPQSLRNKFRLEYEKALKKY